MQRQKTEFPRCPLSGILVGDACAGSSPACGRCGWNPAVNQKRREEIRHLAAEKRLREWGKRR